MFKNKYNLEFNLMVGQKDDEKCLEFLLKDGWKIKQIRTYTKDIIHFDLEKGE